MTARAGAVLPPLPIGAQATHVERSAATANLIDVLDRVLDKGIVIDAWVRVSLVGIELVTVEARVVVASIGTYLGYAPALADLKPIAAPTAEEPSLIGQPPS